MILFWNIDIYEMGDVLKISRRKSRARLAVRNLGVPRAVRRAYCVLSQEARAAERERGIRREIKRESRFVEAVALELDATAG